VHLGFWACVALGVLTKGPVALALPLLVAVTMRLVAPLKVSLRPVVVGWGPILCLTLVLAWLVPAGLAGGAEYTTELLVRQTADRVASSSFGHPEPFYYHLVTYPVTGLPWSPLVIAAVVAARRRREPMAMLFLAVGVVTLVVTFSLVSGKLVVYLLPMFPLAALLAAERLLRGARGNRGAVVAGALAMLVIGAALASAPFWRPELGLDPMPLALAGAAVAVPAALALALAFAARETTARSVGALAAAGFAFVAVSLPATSRVLDSSMSVAGLAAAVVEVEPDRAESLIYLERYPGLWLYAERRFAVLSSPAELAQALRDGRWVVIKERDLPELPEAVRSLIGETRPHRHKRRTLLLVRAGGP
jgi:4-amino-4-deoxy-L-arabinose transferase-like glycosyltransferase